MIVEQLYPGEKDHVEHFYNVLPAFKDKRYITVENEPIFLIYAPLSIPDITSFIQIWKDLAKKNGLKGIHFVGLVDGWIERNKKVLNAGFDATSPGNLWYAESKVKGKYLKIIDSKIRQKLNVIGLDKYKYKEIIKYLTTEYDYQENAYPTAVPQWDRSPRSGKRAVIYYGSTPDLFKEHLKNIKKAIENKPFEKRIVFLRSWNEWGEGNYMNLTQNMEWNI